MAAAQHRRPGRAIELITRAILASGAVMAALVSCLATAQAQDAAGSKPASMPMTWLCLPADQLDCACQSRNVPLSNPVVLPCFLGDVDRQVENQVDPFAAKVFSALNWPSNGATGIPEYLVTPADAAAKSGIGDYLTVWDTWPNARALYRTDKKAPEPWATATPPLPPACQALDVQQAIAAQSWAQVPENSKVRLLDDFIDPDGFALIDKAGTPVRYEVLYNRQAYKHVSDEDLWAPLGMSVILSRQEDVGFPAGHWTSDPTSRGAIILKAGWKVLDKTRDDPSHFHKSWAYITPIISNGQVQPDSCEIRPVGLIAMHIALKTQLFPDWLWTTFEHLAIAPTWEEYAAAQRTEAVAYGDSTPSARRAWMFYSPLQGDCDPTQPCPIVAPLNTGQKASATQVGALPSRLITMQPRGYAFPNGPSGETQAEYGKSVEMPNYDAIDAAMRQGFDGSALRFYRLKGTQWVKPGRPPTLHPETLANSVLEAFTQSSSSCLGCHSRAGREGGAYTQRAHPFDYIFGLSNAGIGVTVDNQTPPGNGP